MIIVRYKEVKLNDLLLNDNYVIYDYCEDDAINLYIKSKNNKCKCPNCKAECGIHSIYKRVLLQTNNICLLKIGRQVNKKLNLSINFLWFLVKI